MKLGRSLLILICAVLITVLTNQQVEGQQDANVLPASEPADGESSGDSVDIGSDDYEDDDGADVEQSNQADNFEPNQGIDEDDELLSRRIGGGGRFGRRRRGRFGRRRGRFGRRRGRLGRSRRFGRRWGSFGYGRGPYFGFYPFF